MHDGLRVALLTDLHHSEFTSQADIARAVDLAMAPRPDVIVLGGDYVSFAERRYMEPCAEALAPLEAPGGVLAILGNHDDDRYMPAALERRGFTVLKDSLCRFGFLAVSSGDMPGRGPIRDSFQVVKPEVELYRRVP